jgi:DNA repair exonuclease SbcCD ATPase subunit
MVGKSRGEGRFAAKDAEIAALQSTLLAQETERQGELDRLAKQFAEERFKLEKSKEDLDWKLKDQKEVAERQLTARRKEIQVLEAEVQRAKAQRNQDLAQKNSIFETEKEKIQSGLIVLQNQVEDDRRKQEQALNAREDETQLLLVRSKERLRVLGEEFNQKVGLWKSTNETLRAQIEQMKGNLAQAQDHWEVLQKEKAGEINTLRQDLASWEARIQSDAQALERSHDQDVQVLTAQIRRQENELEELRAHFAHQLADKEEAFRQAQEDIQHKESSSEIEWQSSLDQWQKDKQALQQEKSRFEKELQDLKRHTDVKNQEMEEASSRLRMDIVFKETEIENQRERLSRLREKDTAPLEDRLGEVSKKFEDEKRVSEAALRRKEDDIRALTGRLAMREKRLQEETRRRAKEIEGLKKQVEEEETSVRAHFGAESARLERLRKDQEAALDRLVEKETAINAQKAQVDAQLRETIRQERQDLEQSLRDLEAERLALQRESQALLVERENKIQLLTDSLDEREQAMENLRDQSRQLAESLRKRMEVLRQSRHPASRSTGSNVGAWTAFEQGVQHYQQQAWTEAIRAFEQCLTRDPRWGAAYQYLALSYHAQGDDVRAAQVAERALREDPSNTELGNWIERLRASIQTQKKAS